MQTASKNASVDHEDDQLRVSPTSSASSSPLPREDEDVDMDMDKRYISKKKLFLLDMIARVQQYLQTESIQAVLTCLLEGLLDLMESEFGFIAEVKYEEDGTPYLLSHATTNIAWNAATRQFYNDNIDKGLTFYNMKSLFGAVVTSQAPVISNGPAQDARSCGGCPAGHPPINCFLGIPFFKKGGELMGVIGLANQPGGYSEEDIEFLKPITSTCANLMQAHWQVQQNKELINSLEQKVKERTRELEELNKSLEEANQRVVKASQAQLQSFACMSHEIRTPLNCIIGLSSLLQETELTPQQAETVRMIVASGDLLLTVVNDVLDYSKLESGNVDIEIRRCNLQDTFQSIVHSIELKSANKGLKIQTTYDPALPEHVHTDSRRLQQILYNLLGNAVKFSEDNGRVDVSAMIIEKDESCPVTGQNACSSSASVAEYPKIMPSQKEERILRLVVKDYGKGIEKKDFKRIFEPFSQACAETERVYGGTGLGLAVTAKLVKGLGGTVSVESELGKWSKFIVDLPFVDPPVNAKSESKKLVSTTVLFVDAPRNDAPSLDNISLAFQYYDVVLETYSSLQEVLNAAVSDRNGFFSRDRHYVCLLNENLYDQQSYKTLASMCKSILITFGPGYLVNAADHHVRSLTHMIPYVLIKTVIENVEATKSEQRDPAGASNLSSKFICYSSLKILVAEDNVVNQKVLTRMLTRLGLSNVNIANNGREAVIMEKEKDYDIILMDMQMPLMDGLEACREIRLRQRDNSYPAIIFVTAHVSDEFQAECVEAGAVGFLAKPFSIREIEECLQRTQSIVRGRAENSGDT